MKRHLTDEELSSIVNAIEPLKCLQTDIAQQICNKIRKKAMTELKSIEIYPSLIPDLKNEIVRCYYKTQIQAGECVGILTAQSLGERQTQLCLDAFHSTGISISTVVSGVPRFVELLNATKNPKNIITNICFKKSFETITELRKAIGTSIVSLNFGDLVNDDYIVGTEMKEWHTLFQSIYEKTMFTNYLSYTLNQDLLFKYQVNLSQVKEILENTLQDIYCMYSLTTFDIFVKTDDLDETLDDLLKNTHLFGVKDITDILFIKDSKNVWSAQALGNNLQELGLIPVIDFYKTFSNNMWEIYKLLGIEATREFLIQEFLNVISADSYINKQHVDLLVDIMLFNGNILPISRYGVQRSQSGPLTNSSFEKSLDHFLQAGIYGDLETTNGISSSIMCGKPSISGTGLCELIYKTN